MTEPGEPKPPRRSFNGQILIATAFSAGCLWLALRDVSLPAVSAALAQTNGWWLLAAVVSVSVTLLAKALRWQVLFAPRRSPSLPRLLSAQSIGMLLNTFAPARLGDLARAYLIGEAEADSKAYALGTVALEKVTDLGCLALALLWLASVTPLPAWLPARQTVLVVAAAVLAVVLIDRQTALMMRLVRWAARLAPARARDWLQRQARLGLSSLQVVRRPRLLAGLLAWSLFIWGVSALTNWLIWKAMGQAWPLPAALLLLVVLQAGLAVPASPGRIGVFQYLTVLTLSLFAVPKAVALSYSVLLHLATYAPMLALGAYCLWREKTTWQKLEEAARRLESRLGRAPSPGSE